MNRLGRTIDPCSPGLRIWEFFRLAIFIYLFFKIFSDLCFENAPFYLLDFLDLRQNTSSALNITIEFIIIFFVICDVAVR
jgi:hypothetical protein